MKQRHHIDPNTTLFCHFFFFICSFRVSRGNLFALPVPGPAPVALPDAGHEVDHLLGGELGAEEPVLADAGPVVPAEVRLDGARVVGDGEGAGAAAGGEVVVEALGEAGDGGLAGAVGVPPAGAVVGYAAHAGGHAEPDGRGGGEFHLVGGGGGGKVGAELGEEVGEVAEEEQGADGVDAEGLEGEGRVDLAGVLLRVEDAGDGAGQAEVVRRRREQGGGVARGSGHGGVVGDVEVDEGEARGDVLGGRVRGRGRGGGGEALEELGFGGGQVRVARGGQDGERGCLQEAAGQGAAYAPARGADEDPRRGHCGGKAMSRD